MVDVLPPVGAYPKWEVNGTATEGYITISVMQNGSIFVKQEMKTGAKTLLKTLQAINNAVTIKEEPMDEDDPVSANPSSTQSTPATVTSDDLDRNLAEKSFKYGDGSTTVQCAIKINLDKLSVNERRSLRPDFKKTKAIQNFKTKTVQKSGSFGNRIHPQDEDGNVPESDSDIVDGETLSDNYVYGIMSEEMSAQLASGTENLSSTVISGAAGKKTKHVGFFPEDTPVHLSSTDAENFKMEVKNEEQGWDEDNDDEEDENYDDDNNESEDELVKERPSKGRKKGSKFLSSKKPRNEPKSEAEDSESTKCHVCTAQFGDKYSRLLHEQNEHGRCLRCSNLLLTQEALDAHKQQLCKCSKCGVFFCTTKELDVHMIKGHAKECKDCGAVFQTQRQCRSHWLHTHGFKCAHCIRTFGTPERLEKHMVWHNIQTCADCGKKFKGKELLRIHRVRMHSGASPLQCEECGKPYKSLDSLKQHMISQHGAEGRFKCEICGRQMAQKMKYDEHMRTHTGERPYVCAMCGTAFKTRTSLDRHVQRHNTERKYECDICGGKYRSKIQLYKHKQLHDPSKAVPCPVCGKIFKSRDSLNVHAEIHKNERKYRCDECGVAYNNRGSLWTHKNKKHRRETMDEDL